MYKKSTETCYLHVESVESFYNFFQTIYLHYFIQLENDYKAMFDEGLQLYNIWSDLSVRLQQLMKKEITDKTYRAILEDIEINNYNSGKYYITSKVCNVFNIEVKHF